MISLRTVAPNDFELICRHREMMFRDAGRTDAALAAMDAPFRAWLEPRLQDGRYFGFIAENDGVPVGGVGLIEIDWPPHPLHPTQARRGYVLNVYVDPALRGQGVAGRLMQASDDEFTRRGIVFASLHATEAGAPLYARLG